MSPSSGKGNYFLAIIPPEPHASEAWKWKEYFRDRYSSKASLNSPAHITMHMPFEWRDDRRDKLAGVLGAFCGKEKPVSISLDGFGCFAPKVIFIGVVSSPELVALQKRLSQTCRLELNLLHPDHDDCPFHPHLTIAFRDLRKPKFREAWEEFRSKAFHREFIAQSLTLLRHDGKKWIAVEEFFLAG